MAQSSAAGSSRGHVLVVDDDEDVRALLAMVLGSEGYQVDSSGGAEEALRILSEERHDLVILDIGLGSSDGRDVLASIRRTGDLPVILLSGRGHEADRVSGLSLGADDYVVKPFSHRELAIRVGTVLRRTRSTATYQLEYDGLRIDTTVREARINDQVVSLTAKEFDLLAFMARSPRQVFSRRQLLQSVWQSSSDWQDEATVTEHVRRVRRKVEEDPDAPRWITTVRGVGYRFEP